MKSTVDLPSFPTQSIIMSPFSSCLGGIVGADWWLSIWSSDKSDGNTTADHDVDYYLVGYTGLSMAAIILAFFKSISIALCCLRGAKFLHVRMLRRIVRAPMRFFDTTPIGRVLNRMSSDTTAIDSNLPSMSVHKHSFSFICWAFAELPVSGILLK